MSTEPAKHEPIRRSIPPRIAATIREEDEALAATIETANALVAATVAAANGVIAAGRARHTAAMRPILRALKIDDGEFVAIEGFGAQTTATIRIPELEKPHA